jgi:MoxR-like ATPase
MPVNETPGSPEATAKALADAGYLADDGIAIATFLALRMRRPLFLEGAAGVGKTSLAVAVSRMLDAPLFKIQCHEGIDAAQALYDWDFPRQVLHLRAAEFTAGPLRDTAAVEGELYSRRFLVARPILRALESSPAVLLIDEVDRADDEFEAFLLEVLADYAVTIPELGTIRSAAPPVVLLTSNRTREVHDALKRRCLYHWLDHPTFEREVAVLRLHLPGIGDRLAEQVTAAARELRGLDLLKPPGLAESIDWASALAALDVREIDASSIRHTIGAVVKHRDDLDRLDEAAVESIALAAAGADR